MYKGIFINHKITFVQNVAEKYLVNNSMIILFCDY